MNTFKIPCYCNKKKLQRGLHETLPRYLQFQPDFFLPLLETIFFLQNNFTQNFSKLFLYRLCHIAHDHLVI